MKARILICMALLVAAGGCWESVALVSSGAVGGMTVARIIQQEKENTQANIDLMKQQLADQDAAIAAEADEAKKAELQEARDNTATVLADLRAQKIFLDGLDLGTKTDWGEPAAAVTTITAIILAILAERERRKKKAAIESEVETYTALKEVVVGAEEFKRVAKENDEAINAFKTAMGDKQSPETKKMVAVIKA